MFIKDNTQGKSHRAERASGLRTPFGISAHCDITKMPDSSLIGGAGKQTQERAILSFSELTGRHIQCNGFSNVWVKGFLRAAALL